MTLSAHLKPLDILSKFMKEVLAFYPAFTILSFNVIFV